MLLNIELCLLAEVAKLVQNLLTMSAKALDSYTDKRMLSLQKKRAKTAKLNSHLNIRTINYRLS